MNREIHNSLCWRWLATLLLLWIYASPHVAAEAKPAKLKKPSGTSEVVRTVESAKLDFPSRPTGNTAVLSVGSPQFTLSNGLTEVFGGTASVEMASKPLENLLQRSGRFQVMPGRQVRHSVRVELTDVKIAQETKESKGMIGKAIESLVNPGRILQGGAKTSVGAPNTFNLDWNNAEAKLTVSCSVTIQLVDGQTGALSLGLAGETGTVIRERTTKDLMVELAGANWNRSAPREEISKEFHTKLIELAFHGALVRMLPALDQKLAAANPTDLMGEGAPSNVSVVPSTAGTPVPTNTTPASSSAAETPVAAPKSARRAKFCSECGGSLKPTEKFCPECGSKIVE